MQIIPEWTPNIHPLIVHFPIAILILAVFTNFFSLVLKKFEWLPKASISLYILGTISAITAFFTGRAAADSLELPVKVMSTLTSHADWAEITVLYFTVFTVVYTVFLIFEKKLLNKISNLMKPVIFLFGLGGLILVYLTADAGAKMVYGYGLGTGKLNNITNNSNETYNIQEKAKEEIVSSINTSDNGSWKFYSAVGAVSTLKNDFTWLNGQSPNIEIDLYHDKNETFTTINPNNNSMLVSYGNKLKNVQIELNANLDSLQGSFSIVHHYIDSNNYDYVLIKENEISMGRISNGMDEVFEKETFLAQGWVDIKIIISGKHFRTNINNKLVVHGHGAEPDSGTTGFKLSGKGSFLISDFEVQVL